MKFRLISYDQSPPGNYVYQQTKGIKRKFGPSPSIEALAEEVSAFRTGNGLPRPSKLEALVDIDRFTCWRLGGMRQYCLPDDDEARQSVALGVSSPLVSGCKGCGAPIMV